MRYKTAYFLHGRGGSPNGTVKLLEEALMPLLDDRFTAVRPLLLHSNPDVPAEDSLKDLMEIPLVTGALLIGVSLGGTLAAKLQEEAREDLTVICISSPTWVDNVRLERQHSLRFALYSSIDTVIKGRTENWPQLAQVAIDVSWLDHDTDRHRHRLVPAIASFVNSGGSPASFSKIVG